MSSKEWGPKLWYTLHLISFNYPDNPDVLTKRYHHDFFENLKHVLPCSICRNHYKNHLETNPITPHLDDRLSFSKWVVNLHNQVNIMLGKPVKSYKDVVFLYNQQEKLEKKMNINYSVLFICITTLTIIYYFSRKHTNLRNSNYRYI